MIGKQIFKKENKKTIDPNLKNILVDFSAKQNDTAFIKQLKTKVLEFGNDITVNPVQNYIGFVRHGKNFLWVKIRKEFMTLGLQVQDSFDDPKNMASQYRKDKENLKRVVFKEKDELEDIMYLVKQAYDTI